MHIKDFYRKDMMGNTLKNMIDYPMIFAIQIVNLDNLWKVLWLINWIVKLYLKQSILMRNL